MTVRNGTLDGNGGAVGGGFYVENSDLTLEDPRVLFNSASASHGGGIYVSGESSSVSIHGGEIRNNTAAFDGAGIYSALATVVAEDILIEENAAEGRGGGIYLTGGDFEIRSALHAGSPGACIPAALPANEYCTEVRGNTAAEGGGVFIYGDVPSVQNPETYFTAHAVAFLDNSVTSEGSALHLEEDLIFASVENSLVRGNFGGRAIFLNGPSELSVSNSSLVANFGNPFYVALASSVFSLANSVVWDNTEGPFLLSGAGYSGSCNKLQTLAVGSAHMTSQSIGDPFFVSTARGDYRLDVASPLIEHCFLGPARDLDGFARASQVDIGALEYVPEPTFAMTLMLGAGAMSLLRHRSTTHARVRWDR